ncbi:unnamed protein product [Gongylonema pulchrum]|uniref:RNF111_N domain-containing protein n=1 Tax=Gongylonema pulchrum TaxID=637853 RepID=A0A183E1M0_9BILA|nr:unnamed protein product [Gongylonema pulchrum]
MDDSSRTEHSSGDTSGGQQEETEVDTESGQCKTPESPMVRPETPKTPQMSTRDRVSRLRQQYGVIVWLCSLAVAE